MAYEFKNLNEVPVQDKPTENTTVMAFESGNPRQIPAGEFGGKGLVVNLRGYTLNTEVGNVISDIVYDPIYEAVAAGQNVVFQIQMDDIDNIFEKPAFSFVSSGQGFCVGLFSGNGTLLPLLFTNGSYHTA